MSQSTVTLARDPMKFLTGVFNDARPRIVEALQNYKFGVGWSTLLTSKSTSLSFDVFLSWVLIFLALYVAFALVWKLLPAAGLSKGKLPAVASSRCIGIVHCCLVVPLSIYALLERQPFAQWSELEYLNLNSPTEQRVIELSVGYFVADFVHFILFEPDLLMFFHHVFSILMMTSAGVIGRGAACATGAIVQGEITNPFQSTWTIARAAKATKTLNVLSPLFTVVFVVVRLSIVPIWTVLINISMWTSPHHAKMPWGVIPWWSAMSALMVLGGFLWSYSLVKGLRKFYRIKAKEAKAAKLASDKAQ